VVGVPNETLNTSTQRYAGAIHILRGKLSADRKEINAMTASPSELWTQSGDLAGVAETGDAFGSALAAGDFNGDGINDIAIGVPFEDLGDNKVDAAGGVNILFGGTYMTPGDNNVIVTQ
jgi:FG-GAP repeat